MLMVTDCPPWTYIYHEDILDTAMVTTKTSTVLLDSLVLQRRKDYPSIVLETVDSKMFLSWTNSNEEWSSPCLPLGGNLVWSVTG